MSTVSQQYRYHHDWDKGHKEETGRTISLFRAAIVTVVVLILYSTNPANDPPVELLEIAQEIGFQKVDSIASKPQVTNYGLFSLEQTDAAIVIHGLNQATDICPFSTTHFYLLCTFAAKQFCHGKALLWDLSDLAFSLYRIITLLLICSAVLSWIGWGLPQRLSLLEKPTIADYGGLIQMYASMAEMEALIENATEANEASRAFLWRALVLIVMIGTCANFLVSSHGIGPSVGALRGYVYAINIAQAATTSGTSQYQYVILTIQCFFWISCLRSQSSIFSILLGVFLGYCFGMRDAQQFEQVGWGQWLYSLI